MMCVDKSLSNFFVSFIFPQKISNDEYTLDSRVLLTYVDKSQGNFFVSFISPKKY